MGIGHLKETHMNTPLLTALRVPVLTACPPVATIKLHYAQKEPSELYLVQDPNVMSL